MISLRLGEDDAAEEAATKGNDLFRARLDQIINEAVQLADKVDWEWLNSEIARLQREGRPGIETRFVMAQESSVNESAKVVQGISASP